MRSATTSIRDATRADADGVVAVFLGCWSVSYSTVLPTSLVEGMTRTRAEALWTRVLADAANGEVIVAEKAAIGGDIVGVTRWAVEANESGRPDGAVHSLYVAPAAQGRGIGAMLLRAAIERLTDSGVETARLWVFRDNAPSIAFYRRSGWLPDGGTRVHVEFGEPEIRLAKVLDR